MYKKKLIAITVTLLIGCKGPFDNDEMKEYKLTGNYYVSSFYDSNTLLYKDRESLKLIGTGHAIPKNVDSIGWEGQFIVGVDSSAYNIIDTFSQKIIETCGSYEIFNNRKIKLGIGDIKLEKVN